MATTADQPQSSLSPVEQRLIEHITCGDVLDLAGDQPVDEAAMRSWDDTRTISASVIRDILRGRHVTDPDPHGLRLRGARIDGRLDLENITSGMWLELVDCFLELGVNARNADLKGLVLSGCRLSHPTEPPLDGDRLTTSAVFLNRTVIDAHAAGGAVRLLGAHLGEQLDCSGARLVNDSGPALDADSLQVGHGMFLNNGFQAIASSDLAAVRLLSAHIAVLDCDTARLVNDSGPALHADNLRVDHGMYLRGGFQATGSSELGAVRLIGAHLGGQLDCSGARLVNDSGPALDADSLQVGHGMFLNNGFQAIASSDLAAVRLLSAHIAVLDCDTARLVNDSGPALHADNLRVDHGMYLRGGFQATGSSELGAVRLIGAHLGGQLDCSGARLVNDSGPALHADNLQVDHGMYLRGGFQATGSSELGAVRLIGAHLGMLDCETARLVNDSGPALNADRLRVDQSMFLGNDFQATASGDDVVLHLSDTHIGGVLFVSPNSLEHRTHPHHKLRLDGLTYTGLPQGVTPDQWLALLRHDTVDYAAQPYQHLAAAHRAAGHDREARHVLIAQRQDQIRRHALTGRTTRMWARLTGLLLGYGYKPWRALIALAAVLAAAVVAAVILGGTYGALAQTRTPPTATPVPCTWVEHVGVGLDLGTPLLTTGTRTRCDTTNTTPGHILTITGWTLRLLAWAFATLFIAGFTGAVRKT